MRKTAYSIEIKVKMIELKLTKREREILDEAREKHPEVSRLSMEELEKSMMEYDRICTMFAPATKLYKIPYKPLN